MGTISTKITSEHFFVWQNLSSRQNYKIDDFVLYAAIYMLHTNIEESFSQSLLLWYCPVLDAYLSLI